MSEPNTHRNREQLIGNRVSLRRVASLRDATRPPVEKQEMGRPGVTDTLEVAAATTARGSDAATLPPRARRRRSTSAIVGGFAGINAFVLMVGVITGPLQARGLGPVGRGELAGITVVMQELSIFATFGLVAYATREVARGTPPGEVLGSIGILLVGVGLLLMPLGFPLSGLLGRGRPIVSHFILAAFLLLPLSLLGVLLSCLLAGLERWWLLAVTRLIPIVLPASVIIGLYLSNSMSVGWIAAVTYAAGMLAVTPSFFALRKWGPLRLRVRHFRQGIPFGLKSWGGYLASLTNARLDQLLMVGLASSLQLGLYAVAVTAASLPGVFIGAVGAPLLTRLSAGERHLLGPAFRTCVATVALGVGLITAASFVAIPLLFGQAFRSAIPMAVILLFAAIPGAGVAVLSPAFIADGAPSYPAIGEFVAVAITVPGLLLTLPLWGGVGAAIVTAAAYSVNCLIQLVVARRRFDMPYRSFLIPTKADLIPYLAILARIKAWGTWGRTADEPQVL